MKRPGAIASAVGVEQPRGAGDPQGCQNARGEIFRGDALRPIQAGTILHETEAVGEEGSALIGE